MNELQQFVKESLEKGQSKGAIQTALEQAHWPKEDVQNALDAYADVAFPVAVPRRRPYLSAREAFLYLVLFMTLYISAISLGTILFQLVNYLLPETTAYVYGSNTYYSVEAVRSATASLIIAFPVFLGVSTLLRRAIARDPEKRGSKIRKWLTYITLFIAAGVIIVDLITLVNALLSGDLVLRFFLKVLIVLVIAATIFGYYLWDLRKEESQPA